MLNGAFANSSDSGIVTLGLYRTGASPYETAEATADWLFDGIGLSCGLAGVTGRMFDQKDKVGIHENSRSHGRYECGLDTAGDPQYCTHWNVSVEGDYHILDYATEVAAACFVY